MSINHNFNPNEKDDRITEESVIDLNEKKAKNDFFFKIEINRYLLICDDVEAVFLEQVKTKKYDVITLRVLNALINLKNATETHKIEVFK